MALEPWSARIQPSCVHRRQLTYKGPNDLFVFTKNKNNNLSSKIKNKV